MPDFGKPGQGAPAGAVAHLPEPFALPPGVARVHADGPRSQEECMRTCKSPSCLHMGPMYCALEGLPERAPAACACPNIGAEGKRLCAALADVDRRRHAGDVLRASEWEAELVGACDRHGCVDRESVLAFLRSCLAAHPPVAP